MPEEFTGRKVEHIYTKESIRDWNGYLMSDFNTVEVIETEFRTALEGRAMLGQCVKRQYDPWAVAYTEDANTPPRKESVMFHKWRGEEMVGIKIILRGEGEIISWIRDGLEILLDGVAPRPSSCVIKDGIRVETYIFGALVPLGTIRKSMSSLMRPTEITVIGAPSPDVE